MRNRLVLLVWRLQLLGLLGLGLLGTGCGNQIGDACFLAIDCSPNGDRICIDATANTEGYCTIQGCDLTTCPDEAVCVRFFAGAFAGTACDHGQESSSDPNVRKCSLDETCSVAGVCVARSSETRFCMLACGSDSDCRDGYECRDLDRMKLHGGQPLLDPPDAEVTASAPKFCAKAP
jgi:hypothetical protein